MNETASPVDDLYIQHQNPENYKDRYTAETYVKEHHIKIYVRLLNNGQIHRTVETFDKTGKTTNQRTETLDVPAKKQLTEQDAEKIANNYLINELNQL